MSTTLPTTVPTGDHPPDGINPVHWDLPRPTSPFPFADPQARLAAVGERLAAVAERLVTLFEKKWADPAPVPSAARQAGPLTNDVMLVDVVNPPLDEPILRRLTRANVYTVGDLTALTRVQLDTLGREQRMGQPGLDDLYHWLARHRLALAPTPPPAEDGD